MFQTSKVSLDEFPAHPKRALGAETPLQGLRVLDFTHFVAGPFATLMLGEMGADVIKVEKPFRGDDFRHYPPSDERLGGEGCPFIWTNRNKQSITVDFKTSGGLQVIKDLIAKSDVLVENFSTGVMDRYGLSYDDCKAINPRLVYCSIAAYSRNGKFSDRLGFDPVIQAESGFIDTTGYPDRDGTRTAASTMDIATAMMACNSILAAHIATVRTGVGQYVEVSLYDTGMTMIGFQAMQHLFNGVDSTRFGNTSPDTAPTGVFHASDASFYISSSNTNIFQRLFDQVAGRPDIAFDPELQHRNARLDRREWLFEVLEEIFGQHPWAHWAPLLRKAGVAAGKIRSVAEALRAPETQDRQLVTTIPHPSAGRIPNIGLPFRFYGTPLAHPVAAPLLGQHTSSVLENLLHYSPERVAKLESEGVFGCNPDTHVHEDPNVIVDSCLAESHK